MNVVRIAMPGTQSRSFCSSVSICFAGHPPLHLRQQLVVDVLERHVDVLHDAIAVGDRADHLVGEAGRIRVHQPQPVNVLQLACRACEAVPTSPAAYPMSVP